MDQSVALGKFETREIVFGLVDDSVRSACKAECCIL